MTNFCRRCSRNLTDPKSIKYGYGPVCYVKHMDGDTRQANLQIDFTTYSTITDKDLARKTYRAIYQLIARLDETLLARGKMISGEDMRSLPVESFDTNTGITLPGFGNPQWFYLHSEAYDLAIWKIGITDEKIMNELAKETIIP